jgi:hypothetical protein
MINLFCVHRHSPNAAFLLFLGGLYVHNKGNTMKYLNTLKSTAAIDDTERPKRLEKGGRLVAALVLAFCLPSLALTAPDLTFSSSSPKSIQFADSKGDLWGTDNAVGDEARKIVKFSGVAGGSPVVYESSNTALLTPQGSSVTLGRESYSVIRDIWPLPDGNVIFSTVNGLNNKGYLYKLNTALDTVGTNGSNNKQAVMNIGERNGVQPAGFRTLHQASLSVASIDGKTVLFFGEYNVSSAPERIPGGAGDWVGLWKSTDMGDTWTKVIEWNTNGEHQTVHIHGLRYNPDNQWLYIFFGDTNAESGIVAWNGLPPVPPDNTPLSQMGTNPSYPNWKSIAGSQAVRTGDMLFISGKCVWIPDVDEVPPGEKLYGQRANYDLSGLEPTTNAVPYIDKIPPILAYRDASSGNLFWSSFRTEGASEQKLHFWSSNDAGLSWGLAAKVDNYPTGTAIANSLFKAPWGELVLSGILGIDFTQPPSGQLPPAKGSAAFFGIGASVNTAPVANNDSATTTKGQAVAINVLSNDTDAQSNIAPATLLPTPPQNGSAVVNAGSITYTPASGFSGTDTFTYTVKDALGLSSNQATVTVTVTAEAPPPSPTSVVAVDDRYTVTANKERYQFINVLAEDGVAANDLPKDAAGRQFDTDWSFDRIGGSGKGTIELDYFDYDNGRFNYILQVPRNKNADKIKAAKRGTYLFRYWLTINGVKSAPATVTVEVK